MRFMPEDQGSCDQKEQRDQHITGAGTPITSVARSNSAITIQIVLAMKSPRPCRGVLLFASSVSVIFPCFVREFTIRFSFLPEHLPGV